MIYSIFSWKEGLYRYYKGTGEEPGVRPKPKIKINAPNGNGVQLEALLPVLPANAQYIGKGQEPKGRIAVLSKDAVAPALGYTFGTGRENPLYHSPWLTLGLWTGGMLVAWKLVHWTAHKVGDKIYD